MANTKSARKRAEKSELQRTANRTARSRMRTAVKKARQAVAAGASDVAKALAEAISVVDSSASKGVIHKNTAARTKSRLAAAARKSAR
jgi:small subunit ribosomal protein S20